MSGNEHRRRKQGGAGGQGGTCPPPPNEMKQGGTEAVASAETCGWLAKKRRTDEG